jgi:magnesium transporter
MHPEGVMISVVAFDFQARTEETIDPAGVRAAVAAGRFCWVDAEGPAAGELDPVLDALGFAGGTTRGLADETPEGAWVHAPDGLRFAVREVARGAEAVAGAPLVVLLGEHGLVTSHAGPSACIAQVRASYREDFARHSRSQGFLLYEIADRLVEGYRGALLAVGTDVEQLQMELFGEVDDAIFRRVSELTRQILVFRKALLGSRELLHELGSRRSRFVPETTQPFLEQLAGAIDRLVGDLATERDALTDTLNLYMGMVSHHASNRLKRLTMISVIFLPLTFLCGVYGMNFVEFPEVHWRYGYLYFWTLVLTIAATLLWVMKRHRWL